MSTRFLRNYQTRIFSWVSGVSLSLAQISCISTEEPSVEPGSQPLKTTMHSLGRQDYQAAQHLLLIGDGPFYLLHLPAAGTPTTRAYDGFILEVGLQKKGVDLPLLYLADKKITGEPVYSILPEALDPKELGRQAPATWGLSSPPPRRSLHGDLFRGGKLGSDGLLARDVQLTIQRLIYFRKDEQDSRSPAFPPNTKLTSQYFVFGNAKQLFAVQLETSADTTRLKANIKQLRIEAGVGKSKLAEFIEKGSFLSLKDGTNWGEISAPTGTIEAQVKWLDSVYQD